MAVNVYEDEIKRFLPLLGNEEKISLLQTIKAFLHLSKKDAMVPEKPPTQIDYSKYSFPVSSIKFNRDEINER